MNWQPSDFVPNGSMDECGFETVINDKPYPVKNSVVILLFGVFFGVAIVGFVGCLFVTDWFSFDFTLIENVITGLIICVMVAFAISVVSAIVLFIADVLGANVYAISAIPIGVYSAFGLAVLYLVLFVLRTSITSYDSILDWLWSLRYFVCVGAGLGVIGSMIALKSRRDVKIAPLENINEILKGIWRRLSEEIWGRY